MDYPTVFSAEYLPTHLKLREQQMQTFLSTLKDEWSHFYCEGDKSTGKTVTALHFLKTLKQHKNHIGIYLRTDRAIMLDFKKAIVEDTGLPLKTRDYPLHFFNQIKQNHIHLLIDDSQKILKFQIFNNFLHSLYENAVENKKKLHLKLFGTIPYHKFQRYIRSDVESRFHFKPLIFPRYNAIETKQIIQQRIDLTSFTIENSAIGFLSAKTCLLVADLRLAFETLRNACAYCEQQNITHITLPIMEGKAWKKTKTDYWSQKLEALDLHSKLLLYCATKIAGNHHDEQVSTREIANLYRKECYKQGLDPLYAQRMYYLLEKMVQDGWLTKIGVAYRGRYGKSSVFKYEMNPETILNVFQKIKSF